MMVYVVFKFDKFSKEWKEIKSFGKKECAQSYIGILSKGTDDIYCIEERESVRGDYARFVWEDDKRFTQKVCLC